MTLRCHLLHITAFAKHLHSQLNLFKYWLAMGGKFADRLVTGRDLLVTWFSASLTEYAFILPTSPLVLPPVTNRAKSAFGTLPRSFCDCCSPFMPVTRPLLLIMSGARGQAMRISSSPSSSSVLFPASSSWGAVAAGSCSTNSRSSPSPGRTNEAAIEGLMDWLLYI